FLRLTAATANDTLSLHDALPILSGGAGLGAAAAISAGLAATPGAVEGAALAAAVVVGAGLTWLAARFREPETLILFGVALSAFLDRKSTRLNSSHVKISYAVCCL